MPPEDGAVASLREEDIASLLNPCTTAEDAATAERADAIAWLRTQVESARPVAGTPRERYLIEHRGLRPPWPRSLLWSERYQISRHAPSRTCLLAVVTNQAGELVAVQSTEIDPRTAMKSRRTDQPRLSRGAVSEGAVFLGNTQEQSTLLVVGEGVESVLTGCLIGPCDAYACLGNVKFIEPQGHHRRVEVLADTDARERARRLARDYAKRGLSAFVVTVPDALGPKADLNDALCQQGSNTVLMAIEDAERFTEEPNRFGSPQFDLEIGSDIEIAPKVIDRLEDLYGPIIVCEGRVWRFDKTHWAPLDDDHIVRFVHRADGTQFVDCASNFQVVKLSKNRVASIIDAALKYRHQPDFFATLLCGIDCESGFVQIAEDGKATLLPHARQWRQRHVVRGSWPVALCPPEFEGSLLAKFLRDITLGDIDFIADKEAAADASDNVKVLGEIAGCVALGNGTRLSKSEGNS